ncbi:MAG: hypothetical protein CVU38_10430 [Chloroflexi bacterium HGW-Chloroflexi-1]|nr:MAG: hypothetical protein CVU38_10430 [Chloroflexi bacterium HGW-Chloroflexi-1]
MVERLVEVWDPDLMDTPYLRRIRERERQAALAEGEAAGLARGQAEGLVRGQAEGLARGQVEGLARGQAAGLARGQATGLMEAIPCSEASRYARQRARRVA